METITQVSKAQWTPRDRAVQKVTIEPRRVEQEMAVRIRHEQPLEVEHVQTVDTVTQVSRPRTEYVDKPVPEIHTEVVEKPMEVHTTVQHEMAYLVPQVHDIEIMREELIPEVREVHKAIPKYSMNYTEKEVKVGPKYMQHTEEEFNEISPGHRRMHTASHSIHTAQSLVHMPVAHQVQPIIHQIQSVTPHSLNTSSSHSQLPISPRSFHLPQPVDFLSGVNVSGATPVATPVTSPKNSTVQASTLNFRPMFPTSPRAQPISPRAQPVHTFQPTAKFAAVPGAVTREVRRSFSQPSHTPKSLHAVGGSAVLAGSSIHSSSQNYF